MCVCVRESVNLARFAEEACSHSAMTCFRIHAAAAAATAADIIKRNSGIVCRDRLVNNRLLYYFTVWHLHLGGEQCVRDIFFYY